MKTKMTILFVVLTAIFMLPAASAEASPGLVGLWHLDGDATDSSGNGNDGTEQGDAGYAAGMFDQALSLDGTGDYVDCGSGASLNITGSITIEAWIYADDLSSWQEIVSKGDYLAGGGAFTYFLATTPTPTSYVRFGINVGAAGDYVDAGAALSTGQWYHVAATFDPTSDDVDIYIDGALSNSGTITNDPPSLGSDPLYIGGLNDTILGVLNEFDGLIDEVRIWDVNLTADDISDSASLADVELEKILRTIDVNDGKVVHNNPSPDTDVPIGTPITFTMDVNVINDSSLTLGCVEVRDNLPADLELVDVNSHGVGDTDTRTKGKSKKVFITWDEFGANDLDSGDEVTLTIEVKTDLNPGGKGPSDSKPGHQEYTSTGLHVVNSGVAMTFCVEIAGVEIQLDIEHVTGSELRVNVVEP